MLLEAGANADQADVDGWTPLRAAAWGGHTEVKVKVFITKIQIFINVFQPVIVPLIFRLK